MQPVKIFPKIVMCSLVWLPLVTQASIAAWSDCPLHQAVYRDSGRQGFTLEFSKSSQSPDLANALARVTVRHAKTGLNSQWELSYGLGYGRFDLFDPTGKDKYDHGVFAFDSNLQPLDAPHGAWLFVSGLGRSNWYSGRQGSREAPLLGDPMWAFERCKL